METLSRPGKILKKSFSFLISVYLISAMGFLIQAQTEEKSLISIKSGDLHAVFVDNNAYGEIHKGGYNGISELYHKDQDSTLFVPAYSGFNLEHIFGGEALEEVFEPRLEPMTILSLSDSEVVLHQPKTGISKVESWTVFRMVPPHYIDVEFRFVAHDRSIFNKGYIGFFWASYINSPKDFGIFLKGKAGKAGNPAWLRTFSEKHGVNSTHLGEFDSLDLNFAPDFNIVLANHFSDITFSEPYYYGRFHNMVFAFLFPEPEEGVIRFTQSPSGGGGNPAWDFQYIHPDFELNKEYSFRTRLVYKKWVDQKDIELEYQSWSKLLK